MLLTSCVSFRRPLDNAQAPEGGLDSKANGRVAVGADAGRGHAKSVLGCLCVMPQTAASRQEAQLTAEGEVRTARSGSRVA